MCAYRVSAGHRCQRRARAHCFGVLAPHPRPPPEAQPPAAPSSSPPHRRCPPSFCLRRRDLGIRQTPQRPLPRGRSLRHSHGRAQRETRNRDQSSAATQPLTSPRLAWGSRVATVGLPLVLQLHIRDLATVVLLVHGSQLLSVRQTRVDAPRIRQKKTRSSLAATGRARQPWEGEHSAETPADLA